MVWEENWVKDDGFEEKTALMTATMFGSKGVLNYILETSCVDVNQACGLDGLLHLILFLLRTLLFQVRLLSSCLKFSALHFVLLHTLDYVQYTLFQCC